MKCSCHLPYCIQEKNMHVNKCSYGIGKHCEPRAVICKIEFDGVLIRGVAGGRGGWGLSPPYEVTLCTVVYGGPSFLSSGSPTPLF